jgi:hypothetical protein
VNRFIKVLGVCAVGAALLPSSALAEPDRTVEFGFDKKALEWEAAGNGVLGLRGVYDGGDTGVDPGCPQGIAECDDTLIKVTTNGTLSFKTTGQTVENNGFDTDLALYTSDAEGTRGEEIAYSAAEGATPNEQLSVGVEPGYYLARIYFAISTEATPVQASAGLVPDGLPPVPQVDTPAPPAPPAPAAEPPAAAPAAAPAPAPVAVAPRKAKKAKTISCKGKKGRALKACKKRAAAQKKAAARKAKKARKARR